MSIKDIETMEKDFLYPADVAPFLHVNAQSIRDQACKNSQSLGFPVSVIGNKVLIPKQPFITFWKGK